MSPKVANVVRERTTSSTEMNTSSTWCASRSKRCIDVMAAAFGLVVLSPAILVISLAILVSSGRPILYVQKRVGRNGNEFSLLKFRTMRICAQRGHGLTRGGDSRVTGIGAVLRKSKLDELPQLVNVLKGEMSLVGPRPDLKEFWNETSPEDRRVLELTPGMTGAASLAFSREEELLAQIPPGDLTSFYLKHLLPAKARLDREYSARATFCSDCGILLRTLFLPLLRARQTHHTATQMETNEPISE